MNGAFMSVTDLARATGVSKQAISKTLARHGARIPTRMDGMRKLVDVDAFDRVRGAETDPSQALRNRAVPRGHPAAHAADTLPAEPRTEGKGAQLEFSQHRAKRESFDAELSRIALEQKMGKLVPVTAVTDAMVACAQKMVRIIDQMPSKAEDQAVRAILKQIGIDLRRELYESLKTTADQAAAEDAADDGTDA